MRAFTFWQPWASMILAGHKPWDNRPRPGPSTIPPGTWIGLHAGYGFDSDRMPLIRALWPEVDAGMPFSVGAVLGAWRYDGTWRAADVAARYPREARGAFGPHCLRIGAHVALDTPIPSRPGEFHRGFWTLPDDVAAQVQAAVAAHEARAAVPPLRSS